MASGKKVDKFRHGRTFDIISASPASGAKKGRDEEPIVDISPFKKKKGIQQKISTGTSNILSQYIISDKRPTKDLDQLRKERNGRRHLDPRKSQIFDSIKGTLSK